MINQVNQIIQEASTLPETAFFEINKLENFLQSTQECPKCHRNQRPIVLNFINWDLKGIESIANVIYPVKSNLASLGARVIFEACDCMMQALREREEEAKRKENARKIANLFSGSMLTDKFKKYTFSNWQDRPNTKNMLELAKSYISNFEKFRAEGQGIILFSKTKGNGKSHLTGAIANHLLNSGVSVVFINVPEFFDKLMACWNGHGDEHTLKTALINCELLILDDLGANKYTERKEEEMYKIINARYSRNKPIIASTNCTLDGLEANLGERTFSRLLEMTSVFMENRSSDFRRESKLPS